MQLLTNVGKDGFWATILCCLGIIPFGLMLAGAGIRDVYLNTAGASWPTVVGTVVNSTISYAEPPVGPVFKVRFIYTANDHQYEGSTENLSQEYRDGHRR